jgi:hypothetical protein
MNNLRRLVVTLCLTSVLAITAFAGETSSPPCAPPVPGETEAPPCSIAQPATDDSSNPSQTETAPASDTTTNVVSVVEETLLEFLIF